MNKFHFKMTGAHPERGYEIRCLNTNSIQEFEDWVSKFKAEGFEKIHTTVMTEREYSDHSEAKDLTQKLFKAGTIYLKANPSEFGIDSIALNDICNSETFYNQVFAKVNECPHLYTAFSMHKAANFLHKNYVKWACNK